MEKPEAMSGGKLLENKPEGSSNNLRGGKKRTHNKTHKKSKSKKQQQRRQQQRRQQSRRQQQRRQQSRRQRGGNYNLKL